MDPSLSSVSYNWNGTENKVGEMFRNTQINLTSLMDQATFDRLTFNLTAKKDEQAQPMNLNFTKDDFKEVSGQSGEALFKKAVYEDIEKSVSAQYKINLSTKYQVLCEETAIIGVLKEENKATGELQESTIAFGKDALPEPVIPKPAPKPAPVRAAPKP